MTEQSSTVDRIVVASLVEGIIRNHLLIYIMDFSNNVGRGACKYDEYTRGSCCRPVVYSEDIGIFSGSISDN